MQTEGAGDEGGRGPALGIGLYKMELEIADMDIAVDSYYRYKVFMLEPVNICYN